MCSKPFRAEPELIMVGHPVVVLKLKLNGFTWISRVAYSIPAHAMASSRADASAGQCFSLPACFLLFMLYLFPSPAPCY